MRLAAEWELGHEKSSVTEHHRAKSNKEGKYLSLGNFVHKVMAAAAIVHAGLVAFMTF